MATPRSSIRPEIRDWAELFRKPHPPKETPVHPNNKHVIGDLHGNGLKLLYFLVRCKLADISEKDYAQFVALYRKKNDQFSAEDLHQLEEILKRITIFHNRGKLCLIGDKVTNPGSNDLVTWLLLDMAHQHNLPVEIIISNPEFIRCYEQDFSPEIKPHGIIAEQIVSGTNLQNLITQNIISKETVKKIVARAYIPFLKLISYSLDYTNPDNPKIIIDTHAPASLALIVSTLKYLGFDPGAKRFHAPTMAEGIAKWIDAINKAIQIKLLRGELSSLYTFPSDSFSIDPVTNPLDYLAWNTRITHDRTLIMPDIIEFRHGHTGSPSHLMNNNVLNLNNNLGQNENEKGLLYGEIYRGLSDHSPQEMNTPETKMIDPYECFQKIAQEKQDEEYKALLNNIQLIEIEHNLSVSQLSPNISIQEILNKFTGKEASALAQRAADIKTVDDYEKHQPALLSQLVTRAPVRPQAITLDIIPNGKMSITVNGEHKEIPFTELSSYINDYAKKDKKMAETLLNQIWLHMHANGVDPFTQFPPINTTQNLCLLTTGWTPIFPGNFAIKINQNTGRNLQETLIYFSYPCPDSSRARERIQKQCKYSELTQYFATLALAPNEAEKQLSVIYNILRRIGLTPMNPSKKESKEAPATVATSLTQAHVTLPAEVKVTPTAENVIPSINIPPMLLRASLQNRKMRLLDLCPSKEEQKAEEERINQYFPYLNTFLTIDLNMSVKEEKMETEEKNYHKQSRNLETLSSLLHQHRRNHPEIIQAYVRYCELFYKNPFDDFLTPIMTKNWASTYPETLSILIKNINALHNSGAIKIDHIGDTLNQINVTTYTRETGAGILHQILSTVGLKIYERTLIFSDTNYLRPSTSQPRVAATNISSSQDASQSWRPLAS